MSDKFVMTARQAAELDYAFERNGFTPEDVKKLSSGKFLADVRSAIRGEAEISTIMHIIDLDAAPFIPAGLSLSEHRKGGLFKWDPSNVLLCTTFDQGHGINGIVLLGLMKGNTPYNANLLDYLLQNQHLIPKDWGGKSIYFWGTIYLDKHCFPCVRSLRCSADGSRDTIYRSLRDEWVKAMPAAIRLS